MQNKHFFLYTWCILAIITCAGCCSQPRKSAERNAIIESQMMCVTIKYAAQQGLIRIGMKDEALKSLIGQPESIVKVTTDYHYDEQWLYVDKSETPSRYYSFHFQDHKLLEWQ